MDFVEHVYYINLDHRTDRKLQFEEWIQQTNFPLEKVTRISAIHIPGRGHIGCTLSHIKAIEQFINSPYNNCIIYEDDYTPIDALSFWSNFQKLKEANIDYDVIMCAYNCLKYEDGPVDFLKRVKLSYTASGYLITKKFAPVLLENIKEAAQKAERREKQIGCKADEFCIDVHWMKLMPLSKWYCFYPRIGKQCASYSDIRGAYSDYNA
jgi:hypothetical protein